MAEAGKEKKKKELLQLEENFKCTVLGKYWDATERMKRSQGINEELKPIDFHTWGKKLNIKERSPTLRMLVERGKQNMGGLDYEKLLHNILQELELHYEVTSLNTIKNQTLQKGHIDIVMYDVHSVPRVSFRGMGKSKSEATAKAAERGVNYYTVLAGP